jgi:antitoxin CcdA
MRREAHAAKDEPQQKTINHSIDADLLAEAKEAGTNMSALLEQALKEELRERRWQKWREENREALEAHNRFVEEHGLLSEEWRTF